MSEKRQRGKPVLFRVTNNLNIGGITSRLRLVLPRLTPYFDVHVVTYKQPGVLVEELSSKGVHVHHLQVGGKWSPLAILRMARLFRRNHASIVHTHSFGGNITGILAAALAGVPVRFGQVHARNKHWYGKSEARRKKQQREELLVHKLFTDAVIFPSPISRDYFAGHCPLPERMLRVVPNGIDLSYAQSRQGDFVLKEHLQIPAEKMVLGYVGRLDAPKGIYFALGFMKKLLEKSDKYVLVVVGGAAGADEEERIQNLFSELGKDRVFFAGMRDDVYNFYLGFDAFFFPSEPEGEALPGVVLEAAAYGLPILARQNGAVKAIAEHYGRMHFMDDKADPLESLEALLALPQADPEVIWNRYGIENMVQETLALYNEFLGKKKLETV